MASMRFFWITTAAAFVTSPAAKSSLIWSRSARAEASVPSKKASMANSAASARSFSVTTAAWLVLSASRAVLASAVTALVRTTSAASARSFSVTTAAAIVVSAAAKSSLIWSRSASAEASVPSKNASMANSAASARSFSVTTACVKVSSAASARVFSSPTLVSTRLKTSPAAAIWSAKEATTWASVA